MAPLLFASGSSAVSAALATMSKSREQERAALVPAKAVSSRLPAPVIAASAAEGGIKLYTPAYYWTCAVGGVASCGLTHMGVTPLDVVKCNMQTDPKKYSGIGVGERQRQPIEAPARPAARATAAFLPAVAPPAAVPPPALPPPNLSAHRPRLPGFRTIVAEQGVAGLFRGWVPTLLGYSAQGACKFGLYEYFKK
jgi:solute carrier family 25 phosphate transporter 3